MRKTVIVVKESVLALLEKHKFIQGDHWRTLLTSSDKFGHVRVNIGGKFYYIHRLSMYIFKDFDLDSDLLICHKVECEYPDCWNPEHLYVGTPLDNSGDIIKKKYENPQTHFRCGHARTTSNVCVGNSNGYKSERCIECKNRIERERYHKKRRLHHAEV